MLDSAGFLLKSSLDCLVLGTAELTFAHRKDLDEVPVDDATEDQNDTISLSVDDLIQYAQPMPTVQLIQVNN